MITLLTGLPGHGKTYYLTKTLKELIAKHGQDRRYFVNGIPDFSLPGVEPFDAEKWYELPEKSFFVIDEAQRIFPTAQPGTPIGKKLSEFETHRHRGLDCIIITQHSGLIHHHLRRLVGEHIHVKRPFGMSFANVMRFEGVKNPEDYHDAKTATKSVMRFSPDIWSHYRSATHHTVKMRIPFKLILLPLLLVLLGGIAWYGVQFFKGQQKTVSADGKIVSGQSAIPGLPTGMQPHQGEKRTLSPEEYLKQWEPRIAAVPSSAPRYDELTKPADFPRVAACVVIGQQCKCWTQQATAIKVSDSSCRSFVNSGEFDDTLPPSYKTGFQTAANPASSQGNVANPAGGKPPTGLQRFPGL